ncbi:MAG: MFS transporter [Actinomycetota bacterium]|nr:MFS transporter [Actinomycetota bacterium]
MESGAHEGYRPGSSSYRRLALALFLAGVATFAQLYSPQAVLPQIAADLHVGAAGAALSLSLATLGVAVGVIPWSLVSDHIGRVPAMSFALVAATACALAVAWAPTLPLLLAGRFVEGLMVGAVPAVALAYLAEEVDPLHATRAAGTYVAGTTVGGLLGRVVAGPIAAATTWSVGVFAVALLCAVAAALFLALVPHSRGFTAPQPGWRPAGAGAVHRVVANLRAPRQLSLYAQAFLLMGGFVALYNFLVFRLAGPPFDLPQALVSLIFVAYLAGTWSSSAAGVLASRIGRRPVLVAGTVTMMAGVGLTLSRLLVLVLVGLVVATAGFFAAHAVASGWTAYEATTGRAQASSLYILAYYAGSSVFGWLGGVFFDRAGWTATAALILALALTAAALALLVLRPARA